MTAPLWIGGRIRAPFLVEKPEPHYPDLILWLDASRDQLLVADVVEPSAPPSLLADHLKATLAQSPQRPSRVRVPDQSSADSIRSLLALGTTVEVGPTPELDTIVELMRERMAGEGRAAPYLRSGTVAAAAVECLFRESAALYRAAPWRSMADSDVLEMDIPALGIAGACVSVLGALKQNFGILVFDSFDDFEEFGSTPHAPQGEDSRAMEFGVSFLSLGFERGADITDDMRREIGEHRWPVAGPRAYPVVLAVERDANIRPLRERDVRTACTAAGGVAAIVRRYGPALRSPGTAAVVETVAVETPEPTEVALRYPHSAIAHEQMSTEPPSDEERERAWAQVQGQLQKFLAWPGLKAKSEEWREDAGFVCESLHQFKMDYVDGRADGLAARHVGWFLLDHYPRKVSASQHTIERTPEILDRYFEWLGEAGIESAVTVERLRARVARVREEFMSLAADPQHFGLAKSFAVAMHEAGVDFGDEAAVAGYITEYNRNLERTGAARGGAPRRRTKSAAPSGRARSAPKRWMPSAAHPAPDPARPCPCGSGRRYKRCCMPR